MLLVAVFVIVFIGILFFKPDEADSPQSTESSASSPSVTPTPTPAVCRAEGEFVAGFMSPSNDDQATQKLLNTMDTDAVTFGGWVAPTDLEEYPEEVSDAVGERDAYSYSIHMNWADDELADEDTVVNVDDTAYGIIDVVSPNSGHPSGAVVITESPNGNDPFASLTRVARSHETQAFVGMPLPRMQMDGEPWLPDNSYAEVVDGFSQKFVRTYNARGADGYYLAMEMPLTDEDHWSPITDYYSRQTSLINDILPGTAVIIAPYFEAREGSPIVSVKTAVAGYEKFLNLANGTYLYIAPQDGLGTDTTALEADDSETHAYTTEDYFSALAEFNSEHLLVTIEAMTPGEGTSDSREPATRDRVEQQLSATAPYVQGAIGYQWSGPTPMTEIPHIGAGACASGPGALKTPSS